MAENHATIPSVPSTNVRPSLKYTAKATPLPSSLLSEAGAMWLKAQAVKCRPRTLEDNRMQLSSLIQFFGDIALSEFHIGHFEHYQESRIKNVAPDCVNHELSVLSKLLRMTGLWSAIRDRYTSVPLAREPKLPRIFTADEQLRILKVLKTNPLLDFADIIFTITKNTPASGSELRYLRLRNIELEANPPRIHIPLEATKNNFRPRTIPLSDGALIAFQRAVARAKKVGSHYPEDFLFPLCISYRGDKYDPKRPASRSWLQRPTRYLRSVTGIEHINPHVFRHLAVTELLESGAPEQTVIELAGWVNRKMISTYSHARIESKVDALNRLGKPKPKEPTTTTVSTPVLAPALPPASLPQTDTMQALLQAEIQRQVALALQGMFAGMGNKPGS